MPQIRCFFCSSFFFCLQKADFNNRPYNPFDFLSTTAPYGVLSFHQTHISVGPQNVLLKNLMIFDIRKSCSLCIYPNLCDQNDSFPLKLIYIKAPNISLRAARGLPLVLSIDYNQIGFFKRREGKGHWADSRSVCHPKHIFYLFE